MSLHKAPKAAEWPRDGLERLGECPICGSDDRKMLHEGLTDRTFFVAPGKWTMWQCGQCRSAYLDPRPNRDTIGLAYSSYYTHSQAHLAEPRTRLQRVRKALANGYRNQRYGTQLSPSSKLGPLAVRVLPPLGWSVDLEFRYLPPRQPGSRMCVLDVGSGSGYWLQLAQSAGWEVAGVEPDPVSSSDARERGFDVRNSIDDYDPATEQFDYITMCHVIEHVHDPIELLRKCHALLLPGGGIYVDTPNIDATGHRRFGRDWHGLDSPRHLLLFNRASLLNTMEGTGFVNARYRNRPSPFGQYADRSRRISAGIDPYEDGRKEDLPPRPGLPARLRAAFARRDAEFLTLTAERTS